MSKLCPLYGVAIYMDCMECDEKPCKAHYDASRYNPPNETKSPLTELLVALEDKAGVNDGS